jgi:hypothetical protein
VGAADVGRSACLDVLGVLGPARVCDAVGAGRPWIPVSDESGCLRSLICCFPTPLSGQGHALRPEAGQADVWCIPRARKRV